MSPPLWKAVVREILVIRFSSLGDLCVLGSVLAHRAAKETSANTRVTLVTKAAFAPLLAEVRGVDEIIVSGAYTGNLLAHATLAFGAQ